MTIVFYGFEFDIEELEDLEKTINSLGGQLSLGWDINQTTHLVVGPLAESWNPKPYYEALNAMLYPHIWYQVVSVVTHQWFTECLHSKQHLDEELYTTPEASVRQI